MHPYIKFRGSTYVLSYPSTQERLAAFVAAATRRVASEEPLARVQRLIKVAKYVQALQQTKAPSGTTPPPTPQDKAMDVVKTELLTSLNDFFKNLQASTKVVDALTVGQLLQGTTDQIGASLDKSTAIQSIGAAKQALTEAAKVFPDLGKAGLDAKLDQLGAFWKEWDKFLRSGPWIAAVKEGVTKGMAQLNQGRDTLKKKLFEVQGPIAQLIEKSKGA